MPRLLIKDAAPKSIASCFEGQLGALDYISLGLRQGGERPKDIKPS